jgi:hypothetical protein
MPVPVFGLVDTASAKSGVGGRDAPCRPNRNGACSSESSAVAHELQLEHEYGSEYKLAEVGAALSPTFCPAHQVVELSS